MVITLSIQIFLDEVQLHEQGLDSGDIEPLGIVRRVIVK
jgi:hypothetical protein